MYKIAVVRFDKDLTDRQYHFKCDIDDIQIGDIVVVDTINGMCIAKVVDIINNSSKATRWVVQKIDMKRHNERLTKGLKVQEIREKLLKRKDKIDELVTFKILAKEDKEMAELLSEYENLIEEEI